MNRALITDIQRYSVHDGPGIRTLVFFKGCPLSCRWCHNPEAQSACTELMFDRILCIHCGYCTAVCTRQANRNIGGEIFYDRERCVLCGNCVEVCYAGARKLSGINYTVDQVLEKVLKDRVFYDTTGGGVTLSGGEVLLYYRFASELLCKCKDHRIDTAIETSGYAGWKNFLKVVEYCDLVLYDIKHPDSKKHEEFTGQKNDLILENLGRLYALGKKIIIRIPVIPGFNDSVSTMLDIGAIASGVGVSEIHLLPFHQIGKSKWEALSRPYYYQEAQEQDRAVIQELKNILEKKGFTVSIGGS